MGDDFSSFKLPWKGDDMSISTGHGGAEDLLTPLSKFLDEVRDCATKLFLGHIKKQKFNSEVSRALKEAKGEEKEDLEEEQTIEDLAKGLGGASITKPRVVIDLTK